jgi:hypothetical protein
MIYPRYYLCLYCFVYGVFSTTNLIPRGPEGGNGWRIAVLFRAMTNLLELADEVALNREASKHAGDPELKGFTVRSEWELRAALNESVRYENGAMTLGEALAQLRYVDLEHGHDVAIARADGSTLGSGDIGALLAHSAIRPLLKP